MDLWYLPLFMTGGGQTTTQGGGGLFSSPLIVIMIFFGIFYFLVILPQQRKMKKDQEMRASLKEGDRILTSGGILGVIEKVKDSTVIIRVGKNTQLEIVKGAVARKIEKKDELKSVE